MGADRQLMFGTVLVANRGEIAVRIVRTLSRLGIRSVAVYSDADRNEPHVELADTAVRLGPPLSYLAADRILDACRRTGAEAVHPGYGFLAENAGFARACAAAGVLFVGPPPEVIEAMGDKIRAKRTVKAAGVPVVPGIGEPGMTERELLAAAATVGYPLLVKAAAGGGGKGIRVVWDAATLPGALAAARREARHAFGDDALMLERFCERSRHIEIQVLADQHGTVIHLGERECSLQRRYQKVVEECPSPLLDDATRQRMGHAAVDVARACGYIGAGTVEFLCSDGGFFFLEMNTRLQVEHPVTESVYEVDLVEWQLRVAAGEPLALPDRKPKGHAIEARVYAEDPPRGFLPTAGVVLAWRQPCGEGVRVDAGIHAGSVVSSHYDPMLAKVIACGPDRKVALRRLDRALAECVVLGVGTNVAFLRRLLADPDVRAGRLDVELISRRLDTAGGAPDDVLVAAVMARLLKLEPSGPTADPFDLPGGWRIGEHAWTRWRIRVGSAEPMEVRARGRARAAEVVIGKLEPQATSARWKDDDLEVTFDGETRRYAHAEHGGLTWLGRDGEAWALGEDESARRTAETVEVGPLTAPVPGVVTVVQAAVGDQVTAGQTLLVVEAMKMEHPITTPIDGVVVTLGVIEGQRVGMDELLAVVEP